MIALFNCSNCSAIAVSFCGPTNVILAPNSSAAFEAPLLTAFQKSCWKPFAITSTLKSPPFEPDADPPPDLDEQPAKIAEAQAKVAIANFIYPL